jgi:hypothetical protein
LLASLAIVAIGACGGVSVPSDDEGDGTAADGSDGSGSDADGAPSPDGAPDAGEVPDARPPEACKGGSVQLLANPSFEVAMLPGGAIDWIENTPPITYPVPQIPAAHDGIRAAWFGDTARPEQRLMQPVIVPDGATSLSLEYFTCFVTQEDEGEVFDTLTVSLLDTSGNRLEVLAEYTNEDAEPEKTGCNFRRETLLADNPHAGQEIRLELFGLNDEAGLTSFYFDTLALTATCP